MFIWFLSVFTLFLYISSHLSNMISSNFGKRSYRYETVLYIALLDACALRL